MIIAFDFETHLIRPGLQLPPGVCMSWAEVVPPKRAGENASVGGSGVVTAAHGCAYLAAWLRGGAHIIGANTAFDVLVSVVSASCPDVPLTTTRAEWQAVTGQPVPVFDAPPRPHYFDLLKLWVDAYEQGRVHDVFVRQKLLDIAAGCYRYEELPNGKWLHHGYNLAQLSKRLTGRKLSKPEDEDDTDHWRLRFGELQGMPVELYPKEAYDYALEDAVATAEDFIVQEYRRTTDKRIARNFPGRDPFLDETRQTMACLPLKAMSAWGLRTDGPAVERFAEEIEQKILEERADLVAAGLVRPPERSRNMEAIAGYIRRKGYIGHFQNAQLELAPNQTEPPIELKKANFVEAWRATNDVNMWRLANYLAISKDPAAYAAHLQGLVDDGLVEVSHTRDTKAAQQRCYEAYVELGLPVPRTDSYSPDPPPKGKGHGLLECVSLDADACSGSGDPILEVYSSYTSLAKTVSNDLPMLRAGVRMPVHTRFDELIKTGRTSSSKPNVQNVRRLPGIRECFAPRPGHVFIDTDFAMLELHTLAQVCFWKLGFSTLGEALKAGKDPHLMIAARIENVDYDTAKARKEAGDGVIDNSRTAGKGLNFGAAGGLSAATFVVYAWTNYRVRLTLERSKELLALYHETWVEIPTYFKWVKSNKDPYSVKIVVDKKTGLPRETCWYNIEQPWSGRLRAHAAYCEACNSPFQGLGADVAKLALWLVWKATMGLSELGEADPLFGCHMVNFVHDSIMTEVEEARAHAAAMRQKQLMEVAGRLVLPDVPVKSDALVTRQWSKKAQQWRQPCAACGAPGKCACGTWGERQLIPWDLRAACARDLADFAKKPSTDQITKLAEMRVGKDKWAAMNVGEQAEEIARVAELEPRDRSFEYLKGKQWPTDVAREAAIELHGGENVVGKVAA